MVRDRIHEYLIESLDIRDLAIGSQDWFTGTTSNCSTCVSRYNLAFSPP